jgi:hypothetical protein
MLQMQILDRLVLRLFNGEFQRFILCRLMCRLTIIYSLNRLYEMGGWLYMLNYTEWKFYFGYKGSIISRRCRDYENMKRSPWQMRTDLSCFRIKLNGRHV